MQQQLLTITPDTDTAGATYIPYDPRSWVQQMQQHQIGQSRQRQLSLMRMQRALPNIESLSHELCMRLATNYPRSTSRWPLTQRVNSFGSARICRDMEISSETSQLLDEGQSLVHRPPTSTTYQYTKRPRRKSASLLAIHTVKSAGRETVKPFVSTSRMRKQKCPGVEVKVIQPFACLRRGQ